MTIFSNMLYYEKKINQQTHPKYTICRYFNRFHLIRWKQVGRHWEGHEVGEFSTYKIARQVLHGLNERRHEPTAHIK